MCCGVCFTCAFANHKHVFFIYRKFEKCERQIRHLEKTISDKDQENDRLEGRIVELEVRIGKLNTEKYELCQEFEKKDEEKLEL